MNPTRFLMAAAAATFLSTAALAAPPSAAQVSVPDTQGRHHDKMKALFNSQDEFLMFRMQLRQATHGMARDQKKAYRKAEIQKIRAMNPAERGAYFHSLQAKWNALPGSERERMARRMEDHAARHQARHAQNGGQGYDDDQMDQTR
jgi:hypothetical protein